MEYILLDGNKMTSKKEVHKYLKETFNFPDYYGENLDALWDLLSTKNERISISLLHEEKLYENLGRYGKLIVEVFSEVEKSNDNIEFYIID